MFFSGGFMLIRDSSGISELIDFRETAPSASYKEMFVKNSTWAQTTGLSIGVPGELRGFYMAFMKYGSGRFTNSSDSDIKWSDLFTPSINLARNGYLVTKVMAKTFVLEKDAILNSAALRSIFAPKGTLLKEGETMFRKSYADTLESIANSSSPDIFYSVITIGAFL